MNTSQLGACQPAEKCCNKLCLTNHRISLNDDHITLQSSEHHTLHYSQVNITYYTTVKWTSHITLCSQVNITHYTTVKWTSHITLCTVKWTSHITLQSSEHHTLHYSQVNITHYTKVKWTSHITLKSSEHHTLLTHMHKQFVILCNGKSIGAAVYQTFSTIFHTLKHWYQYTDLGLYNFFCEGAAIFCGKMALKTLCHELFFKKP